MAESGVNGVASSDIERDVVVVGGGLAGSAVATVLARRGMSVAVVDRYAEFPPIFRAEKIESDQAALLRKLGLFDGVLERTRIINEIIHGHRGRIVHRRQIEQFGISYCDLVNSVRQQIPAAVDFVVGVVASVQAGDRRSRVTLVDGRCFAGRLVVIASGMNSPVAVELGARKQMVKEGLSTTFGFMLQRSDDQPFSFDAVTYRPSSINDQLGYLTLFRMGAFMRANLFTYWPVSDPKTRELRTDPVGFLARTLAGLETVIGEFKVAGRVETFGIDLYRMENCAIPGVVFLGDAYQSVCPSTGMGLSKVLTDVDVLCNELVPTWRGLERIRSEETAALYSNPRKVQIDDRAVRLALAGRDSVLSTALAWRIRRRVRTLRFSQGW